MLKWLKIKNLLLIEEASIDFGGGLVVITGETGAGKSMIINALLLLFGSKISKDDGNFVRSSANGIAMISAGFDVSTEIVEILEGIGVAACEEVILRRSIDVEYKSRYFINDVPVSAIIIRKMQELLLDVCGQNASRELYDAKRHLKILDQSLGNVDELEHLRDAYKNWRNAASRYKHLKDAQENADVEVEFLRSVVQELSDLGVGDGEEEELIEKRKLSLEKHKIAEVVEKVRNIMGDGRFMHEIKQIEREISKYEERFAKANAALLEVQSAWSEFEAQFQDAVSELDCETDVEMIEARLFKIRSAARKYGIHVGEINKFLELKKKDLLGLDELPILLTESKRELDRARSLYLEIAGSVSKARREGALKLSAEMEGHLSDLKMEGAGIDIQIISENEDCSKWSECGIDHVTFKVRTSVGSDMSDLTKASGGEISRMMLSLKIALHGDRQRELIIFDEIDVGISGSVSTAVGRKLSELSKAKQVLVVTHQAQVAAFAAQHIVVTKDNDGYKSRADIRALSAEEIVLEIARLMSGDSITRESVSAARALLKEAGNVQPHYAS